MPDGFDDILDDHRRVLDLLDRYARDPDDALAQEACREIAMHTEVEERVLYPHLRGMGPGEDADTELADGIQLTDRAELDHAAIGAQVARVMAAPPIDLGDAMAQITEQVHQHLRFEEQDLLPLLRALVDAGDLHQALKHAKHTIRSRAGEPMF